MSHNDRMQDSAWDGSGAHYIEDQPITLIPKRCDRWLSFGFLGGNICGGKIVAIGVLYVCEKCGASYG